MKKVKFLIYLSLLLLVFNTYKTRANESLNIEIDKNIGNINNEFNFIVKNTSANEFKIKSNSSLFKVYNSDSNKWVNSGANWENQPMLNNTLKIKYFGASASEQFEFIILNLNTNKVLISESIKLWSNLSAKEYLFHINKKHNNKMEQTTSIDISKDNYEIPKNTIKPIFNLSTKLVFYYFGILIIGVIIGFIFSKVVKSSYE